MDVENLFERFTAGDRRALARLITLIENRAPEVAAVMSDVYSRAGRAIVIGLTGPPGAGKSTLADKLIAELRGAGKTVGVVAVDPSSPFSGGAVLGDRVRMQAHFLDPGVFIRSLSSRGRHGGLAGATREVVRLLDAFGFDVILVETVGVGQTELDIMRLAHTTVVVLVPEAGDTIQVMKAGLLEIADVFVVNKADRDGARRLKSELESMLHLRPASAWSVPVVLTEAISGAGISELASKIEMHGAARSAALSGSDKEKDRLKELSDVLRDEVTLRLEHALASPGLAEVSRRVREGTLDPYSGAAEILSRSESTRALLQKRGSTSRPSSPEPVER
jgi:LAO/AO transport system kinase